MPDDEVLTESETLEVPDEFNKERAMETIRKLRDEVKTLKPLARKLTDYEKAEAERQAAEMTESERLRAEIAAAKKEAEEARTQARDTLIRSAFVSEAAKAGAAHPEDVYRLADLSGVEIDEAGAVTGVTEAVKALVDAGRVPLLGKQPAPSLDGGAGGRERTDQTTRLTPLEVDIAKRMGLTAEQYQKSKAAIAARSE